MLFLKNFIIGMLIGAGAIIPGVSSGVICVILGIYEKLLEVVLNIKKHFKDSIKILVPTGIGAIFGIIIFGKIIKFLLVQYPIQVSFIFIGLIVGSIPELIKNTNQNSSFKVQYMAYLILALLIGVGMVLLERNLNIKTTENFSMLYLFMAGMCMSVGVVVPGVSSTVILMILGVYNVYLSSIVDVYLPVLLPIYSGVLVGSFFCMKLIKVLLDKYYAQTFYSIIGFTAGSVLVLYKGFSFDLNGCIYVLYFILGWMISYKLK